MYLRNQPKFLVSHLAYCVFKFADIVNQGSDSHKSKLLLLLLQKFSTRISQISNQNIVILFWCVTSNSFQSVLLKILHFTFRVKLTENKICTAKETTYIHQHRLSISLVS